MRMITSMFAGAVLMLSTPAIASAQYANNAERKNIVETAVAAGNFTTLAGALAKAGLVDALSAEGPFTVFAPTDAAFARLPDDQRTAIMNDNALLKRVLLSHVISGVVNSSDALKMSGASKETLSGMMAQFKVNEGNVVVNLATVVDADILASNGVIHTIDRVIIPIEVEMAINSLQRQ